MLDLSVVVIAAEVVVRHMAIQGKASVEAETSGVLTMRWGEGGHHAALLKHIHPLEDRLDGERVVDGFSCGVVGEVAFSRRELLAVACLGSQKDPDGIDDVRLAGVVFACQRREARTEGDLAI